MNTDGIMVKSLLDLLILLFCIFFVSFNVFYNILNFYNKLLLIFL